MRKVGVPQVRRRRRGKGSGGWWEGLEGGATWLGLVMGGTKGIKKKKKKKQELGLEDGVKLGKEIAAPGRILTPHSGHRPPSTGR